MITRPIKYLVILFVVAGLLFALDEVHAFDFGFDLANRFVVGPVVQGGASVFEKSISVFESMFLFRSFLDENRRLEQERDHFRGEYFRLQAVEEENKFLREALEFGKNPVTTLLLADVIAFDPLRPNQLITINRGKNDGVKKGDPVILAGRVLVGRIDETTARTSRVLLLTSEKSRVVTRLERSGTNAIISGSASGALILDLVLPETELAEGEIIVSSGLEGDIPPNLLVGQVSKVISEETASFKKAVVRPFFGARDLSQVFVMINK